MQLEPLSDQTIPTSIDSIAFNPICTQICTDDDVLVKLLATKPKLARQKDFVQPMIDVQQRSYNSQFIFSLYFAYTLLQLHGKFQRRESGFRMSLN